MILSVLLLECVADPVLEEEVKNVYFSMKPLKAPGIDGLHASFTSRNGKLWVLPFVSLLLIFFYW